MSLAWSVLSDLPPEMSWALGGGTALALHLNHRVSHDVDIFLEHPGSLKMLLKNPKTRQITSNWEFPGNDLKLILGPGEIDFILASDITETPRQPHTLRLNNGKEITFLVETPLEIVAKKLKYRASTFTLRDTFDLACAVSSHPDILQRLASLPEVKASMEKAYHRICLLKNNRHLVSERTIFTDTTELLRTMFDITLDALEKTGIEPGHGKEGA